MRQAVVALAAGLILASAPAAQQAGPSSQPTGRRLALLVGVTEFIAPAMKQHGLEGPANDVALFRTLLTGDAFNVPADAIVSLAGLPADPGARPTRANIEREFLRLRDLAARGDQVLILLAGHGSQQPADPDPADDEPDGLDEIFLPADVEGWDGKAGRVTNAIADDDIRRWVGAIRNKGAVVSILIDACHSGTMTRAGPSERRERGIPAGALIPEPALARAVTSVTRSSAAQTARPRGFDLSSDSGDIAAIYAADVVEGTPELAMPDRTGPVHGLFTYTMSSVLSGRSEPITYRELVQRVIDRYRAEGFGPTPSFEGAGVDRFVLGEQTARDRAAFSVGAHEGEDRWAIAAGSIHGLTAGSILEVSTGGHLRVVEVRPASAVATPVAFGKAPRPGAERLTGSRARLVFHEFGPMRLRVALLRAAGSSGGEAALERALRSLETSSNGLATRAEPADADWFVQVSKGRVTLTSVKDPSKPLDVAPAGDSDLATHLTSRLRRIGRAANLAALSAYVDSEAALQTQALWNDKPGGAGKPLLTDANGPFLKDGHHLQLRVKNVGKVPLDVTVLYVDANFGIKGVFPALETALDNRIDPGRDRLLYAGKIVTDTVGWESVVAIGVESTPRHENFLMLEQEGLVEVRGAASASPLRALLQDAVFGTRGRAAAADQDRGRFAINQTWFRVDR